MPAYAIHVECCFEPVPKRRPTKSHKKMFLSYLPNACMMLGCWGSGTAASLLLPGKVAQAQHLEDGAKRAMLFWC